MPLTEIVMQETDNPDLRDRAYVYWRLLSTDPEAAKEVVLADKPVISDATYTLEPPLVDVLLKNISSIASVYHKPPEVFALSVTDISIRAGASSPYNVIPCYSSASMCREATFSSKSMTAMIIKPLKLIQVSHLPSRLHGT